MDVAHEHGTRIRNIDTELDWQVEAAAINLDIPGIQAKGCHTHEALKSLNLEAPSVAYPSTTRARVHTDETAKNGVFMDVPDGSSIRKSAATGRQSTNY